MAEPITADNLRARMENRLAFLHYNDQYHGRHAGVYEFLSEMLADDILEDDGSSGCVKEDTEHLLLDSAPIGNAQGQRQDTACDPRR